MSEYEKAVIELLTEIRNEIYRQGETVGSDTYGRSVVNTRELA